ncbi:hypothetical protein MRX96_054858 [Rhipicephalus microplus]
MKDTPLSLRPRPNHFRILLSNTWAYFAMKNKGVSTKYFDDVRAWSCSLNQQDTLPWRRLKYSPEGFEDKRLRGWSEDDDCCIIRGLQAGGHRLIVDVQL